MPVDEFYDRDLKEEVHPVWGVTRRQLLIMVGTDHLRDQFDSMIWVKRAEHELINNHKNNIITIIPDIRFDNEAEFISASFGDLINVVRPSELRDVEEIQHKTELGVDTSNAITIMNDGTFEELSTSIHLYLDILLKI